MGRFWLGFTAWLLWLTPGLTAESVPLLVTEYPPYEFTDSRGNAAGFDLEVVRTAFALEGIQVKVRFAPWKRVVAAVRSGRVAGMFSCIQTPEREAFALFSQPISKEQVAIAIRRDAPFQPPRKIAELKDLRVAAFDGYAYNKYLDSQHIPYLTLLDPPLGLLMLARRRVDAVFVGMANGRYSARQLSLSDQISFIPLEEIAAVDYRLCFSRNYPGAKSLQGRFNLGLQRLKTEGTYQKIHASYR